MYQNRKDVSELIGQTIISIDGMSNGSDRVDFKTSNGNSYIMYHQQDCCEDVSLYDVNGDVEDLLNSPILKAEERTSNDHPSDYYSSCNDSFTWTFYTFATIKGYITLRWLGESNGYYSESVNFEIVKKGE